MASKRKLKGNHGKYSKDPLELTILEIIQLKNSYNRIKLLNVKSLSSTLRNNYMLCKIKI